MRQEYDLPFQAMMPVIYYPNQDPLLKNIIITELINELIRK